MVESARPRRSSAAAAPRWHLAAEARAANALICRFCAEDPDRLLFLDVFHPMLGADGRPRPELFLEDRLHLNAEGYALWREIVGPFVR